MATKKSKDLQKAKQRRQKKLVIGGGVLLVLVLAIQVPRTLHRLHPKAPAPVAASTGAVGTASTTDAGGSAAAQTAAMTQLAAAQLSDTDAPQTAGPGQLVVFDRFQSKDPFVQQVTDQPVGATSAAVASPTLQSTPASQSSATPSAFVRQGEKSSSGGAVVISTDGTAQSVAVGATFPSKSPTFRLVSVGPAGAAVAIAGGSYSDGSRTVTLVKGKPLTLMNTNTGTRYRLVYVSGA
jgi:hypothetical protein